MVTVTINCASCFQTLSIIAYAIARVIDSMGGLAVKYLCYKLFVVLAANCAAKTTIALDLKRIQNAPILITNPRVTGSAIACRSITTGSSISFTSATLARVFRLGSRSAGRWRARPTSCMQDLGRVVLRGGDDEQDQFIFAGSLFAANGVYYAMYTGFNRDYPQQGKASQA